MKKTLYLKFILAYLLFALFGFAIVAGPIASVLTERCQREAASDLYREAAQIAGTYASDLYNSEISLDSVNRQLKTLATYNNVQIWILNPSGRVVVNTELSLTPEDEVYIEGFDPSATQGQLFMTGNFFGSFSEPVLSVLSPITENFKIRGYVTIHAPLTDIQAKANSYLNICYILLLVLFLLSLIILLFFTEFVYIPLRRITRATEQYASGNMKYPLIIESDDEIGYLAASLSFMSGQIARSEDDQKKFIANVSHDFRSPLTSIRGFLNAMLDGTIPPELHQKYLGVVLDETDRLTKLTNDLLTLNNLNTTGMYLTITDFDINRVVRNVALSFEQTCKTKEITFELVLTGMELYVRADEERIKQVLYNLIDNAIKFSSRKSSIRLETTEKHSKIFVSVKDSGIGIPKEEQKLIWDRFYKTDLSRGKDKKGTGLGLAIVREILRAHNENINLISTEGVGSEFIFSLKRSDKNDELEEEGE